MISWISYTTATVSADFQGAQRLSGSRKFVYKRSGSVTSTGSNSFRFDRTYSFGAIWTKNSAIPDDPDYEVIILPKATVTQTTTTTITAAPANRFTTVQKRIDTTAWSASTYEGGSDTENNSTYPSGIDFFITGTKLDSIVASQYTVPVTRTVTINRISPDATDLNTLEFVTWTDLENEQVVVGHTIWENPAGFAYISHGDPLDVITPNQISSREPQNSGWEPITKAVWQTTTRITEFYKPYYIKLDSVKIGWDDTFPFPVVTNYGAHIIWAGEINEFFQIPTSTIEHSTIKTLVEGLGKSFPFTTTNQPPGWGQGEDGSYEWPGFVIKKMNTLVGVITSVTQNYDDIGIHVNRSLQTDNKTTFSDSDFPNFITEAEGATGGLVEGTRYLRFHNKLTIARNEPVVVSPAFAQPAAFGSPDLNFSQSQFTSAPLFLELQGAQITLNDLSFTLHSDIGLLDNIISSPIPVAYRGQGKLDVPFPIPSFTAYAKPTTAYTDEQGLSYTAYGEEESAWTTASVAREGASFSSSWSWNVNSTSVTSSSGTAKLVTKHQVVTDISPGAARLSNQAGAAPYVLGGAGFPHATFTISNMPNVLLMTTYDKSTSGTSSRLENAYSEVTTKIFQGNATLTISSWISSVRGHGFQILPFWDLNPPL